MKKTKTYQVFIISILALALLVQSFQKNILLLDYSLASAKYAALCENTDIPEMHCEGKCQVAHKMDETDQNNSKQTTLKIIEYILFCEDFTFIQIQEDLEHVAQIFNSSYRPLIDTSLSDSLIKPPIA